MKDELGHGSDARGTSATEKTDFNKALNVYAAHQSGIEAAAPGQQGSAEGRALYMAVMQHAARVSEPHPSFGENDLRDMIDDPNEEYTYPDQDHLRANRLKANRARGA